MTASFRIERDSMGELQVPADALWGAQTQRAVQNFPISGRPLPRAFIRAIGVIKQAAALANAKLGLLDLQVAQAIAVCAAEVADGSSAAPCPDPVRRQRSALRRPRRPLQSLDDPGAARIALRRRAVGRISDERAAAALLKDLLGPALRIDVGERAHVPQAAVGRHLMLELLEVFLVARVESPARSEPAPGSLKSWHQISSAVVIGRSHRSSCASVP